MARTTPMRIEPKTFFANERTFLSWCGCPLFLFNVHNPEMKTLFAGDRTVLSWCARSKC